MLQKEDRAEHTIPLTSPRAKLFIILMLLMLLLVILLIFNTIKNDVAPREAAPRIVGRNVAITTDMLRGLVYRNDSLRRNCDVIIDML